MEEEIKNDLINYNKVEKNKEKINVLLKDDLKDKLFSKLNPKRQKSSKDNSREMSINQSEQEIS